MRECLVDEVEFITDVHYEECVDESKGWKGKFSLLHWVCVCKGVGRQLEV